MLVHLKNYRILINERSVLTLEIVSKTFESICEEFARKMYEILTEEEKKWMFDEGHRWDMLFDFRLLDLFYDVAMNKLHAAMRKLNPRTVYGMNKKYGMDTGLPLSTYTGVYIIEYYLRAIHNGKKANC